ncbi:MULTISPECIES: hypothetical protein [Brenneria]|nr:MULTISPECIES: hypothetical protein [Brenneria]QCR06728.1 hypothetical protein EH206_22810 [Brenneria nigrifluens DSM 30175 = ATCC 13028]
MLRKKLRWDGRDRRVINVHRDVVARGTAPMMSTVGAFLLFGEQLTVSGVVGLGAIVIDILLIFSQGNLAGFCQPAPPWLSVCSTVFPADA